MALTPGVASLGSLSVRDELRRSTHKLHHRMHLLPAFRAIRNGQLTLQQLGSLLQGIYVFHRTVDTTVTIAGLNSLSSAQERLSLLVQDLTHLGAVPLPSRPWRLRHRQEVLGAIYVAEGSMFGGKVLAEQLD